MARLSLVTIAATALLPGVVITVAPIEAPPQVWRKAAHSPYLRALQIGADRQGTRIELLQFNDGTVKIEQPDVTENQLANTCVLGDAPDNRR